MIFLAKHHLGLKYRWLFYHLFSIEIEFTVYLSWVVTRICWITMEYRNRCNNLLDNCYTGEGLGSWAVILSIPFSHDWTPLLVSLRRAVADFWVLTRYWFYLRQYLTSCLQSWGQLSPPESYRHQVPTFYQPPCNNNGKSSSLLLDCMHYYLK